jgi:two-component system phosphate regulon response regulator PhoB
VGNLLTAPQKDSQLQLKSAMAKSRILVVEDDPALADVLAYNLNRAGYDVARARNGVDGLEQATHAVPDLIVLDLMLPEMDGLEVCRRIRSEAATRNILILMLTAKSEETDQVVGFNVGADDYVTKPFSPRVLLERVKALLRRHKPDVDEKEVVSCHDVTVDRRRHRATAGGQVLQLTRSEFSLLDVMVRQPGRVFTRNELINVALPGNPVVLERTIDVHIKAVRRKLGAHADLIETVRGLGYRFRDPSYSG